MDELFTLCTLLQEEIFEVFFAVHMILMNMEDFVFSDRVILACLCAAPRPRTPEALQMESKSECIVNFAFDQHSTGRAESIPRLQIALLAVWFVFVFPEFVVLEFRFTAEADEVIRMPESVESFDVLSPDRHFTEGAFWVEAFIVIVLAEKLFIPPSHPPTE